jgi:hypothetical protein
MKYMIISLLFVSGSILSLGIFQNISKDENSQKSIVQTKVEMNKYLSSSIELENKYNKQINDLFNLQKISVEQADEVTDIISNYRYFISLKLSTNNLDSRTFKIGSAMLRVSIKRILKGKNINGHKVSLI